MHINRICNFVNPTHLLKLYVPLQTFAAVITEIAVPQGEVNPQRGVTHTSALSQAAESVHFLVSILSNILNVTKENDATI